MRTKDENIAKLLRKNRTSLLSVAVDDAVKWIKTGDKKSGNTSDSYWFELFKSKEKIDCSDVGYFLYVWRLSNVIVNDLCQITDVVNEFRSAEFGDDFSTEAVIDDFGKKIGEACDDPRQFCLASKLAVFIHPSKDVFIWDVNVRAAARFHPDGSKTAVFKGYKDFHAACYARLTAELKDEEFQNALSDFFEKLEGINPLGEIRINESFLIRRFLDKLMFHEGRLIRK